MSEFRTVHMENHRKFLAAMRMARLILAATLLLGILASNFPLAAIASGPTCTLACCAGRAPHAAGSCMHGSCHALLKAGPKKTRQLLRYKTEPLCGLNSTSRRLSTRQAGKNRNPNPETARLASASIGEPCQSDCGTGLSASSNSKRERPKSTLTLAQQLRAPLGHYLADIESTLVRERTERCRKCAPRGPPVS